MVKAFLCLLLAALVSAAPPGGRVMIQGDDGPHVGFVDPVTGKYTEGGLVKLPQTCSPGWDLGTGTQSQGTTTFWMNGTWFFYAQETCGDKINRTVLWGMFGPYDPSPPRIYPQGTFHIDSPLKNWNVAWDWTCNVVVIAPELADDGKVHYRTLQVSEYDGAVRPQEDYFVQDEHPQNGWVKVPGLGGLDYGAHPVWKKELYCGDDCAFYTLEELLVNGSPQQPRRLVGRSFRTGSKMYNVSDATQLQTMTYSLLMGEQPWFFIGIGVCCDGEAWCPPQCVGHKGALTLVAYNGGNVEPYIIELLNSGNPVSDKDAATAVRLGVLFDQPHYNGPLVARILLQNTIVSYNVATTSDGKVTTLFNGTSPALTVEPLAWTPSRFA